MYRSFCDYVISTWYDVRSWIWLLNLEETLCRSEASFVPLIRGQQLCVLVATAKEAGDIQCCSILSKREFSKLSTNRCKFQKITCGQTRQGDDFETCVAWVQRLASSPGSALISECLNVSPAERLNIHTTGLIRKEERAWILPAGNNHAAEGVLWPLCDSHARGVLNKVDD